MRKTIGSLVAVAFVVATTCAYAATKDDKAWVNRCVNDNKNEGAQAKVVRAYCECMNNEMDDGETLSISAWEKKNPKTQAMCSKKAGWK